MNGTIDLFTLIALVAAVVAIIKLRSVLGRRTDDDDRRMEQRARDREMQRAAGAAGRTDKVVTLPRRETGEAARDSAAATSVTEAEARIKAAAGSDANLSRGLLDILNADPAFDPESFLRGARQAYEMIVTAFAEGNRRTLRDLLSRDVYEGFAKAIAERESLSHQIDQSFVGINKADLIEAELGRKGIASITVRFVSQLISATRDKAGTVVAGDPGRIKEVTDIWTFCRDVSTVKARQNLNWRLDATVAPN